MATVADQLREAREAKSLTVQQVAEITKIRPDDIRALDEGNYDSFPAPVYIRGFIRTYAGFLRLEVDQIIEQLNVELGKLEKHRAAPALSPKSNEVFNAVLFRIWRIKWRIVLPLLIAAAIVIGGVYGWRTWSAHKSNDPLAGLGAGLYQPPQKSEGEMLPLPKPQKR